MKVGGITLRRQLARIASVGAAAVLSGQLLAQPVDWKSLRARAGNDDLFVMIDTSLSMAPSMGGLLEPVKTFLRSTLVQYVKKGDRVILLSFDSEARIEGVISIEDESRDGALLEKLIDGLDCRRGVQVTGGPTNLIEVRRTPPGSWQGGGYRTDYCQMWRVATDLVRAYSASSHRQLFLLFTDGLPDAPAYRPCRDPGILDTFARGLAEDRYRLGMVALPSGDGSASPLANVLRSMVGRMPGSTAVAAREAVRVVEVSAERGGLSAVERELAELIASRVDLLEPESVTIGPAYRPNVSFGVTLKNRSRVPREIDIRGASILLDGDENIPLVATPTQISLAPGEQLRVSLAAGATKVRTGTHTGLLTFEFATASRFDPSSIPVTLTGLSWWEAYGAYVQRALLALLALGLLGALLLLWRETLRFAPVQVSASFMLSGGERYDANFSSVRIGEQLAADVGVGAAGGDRVIAVPSPTAVGIVIRRVGAEAWNVSWDGASFSPYLPGTEVSSPETGPGTGCYRFLVFEDDSWGFKGIGAWLRYGLLRRQA